jgi:hypothetical protein
MFAVDFLKRTLLVLLWFLATLSPVEMLIFGCVGSVEVIRRVILLWRRFDGGTYLRLIDIEETGRCIVLSCMCSTLWF